MTLPDDLGLAWFRAPAAVPDAACEAAARARQNQLTKPPGALGQLETAAIRLAALQGRARPAVDRVQIAIFAADHGVAVEGVSAFPQAVTAEMIRNFARGGAAICVLARALDARLEVVNLGTVCGTVFDGAVIDARLGPGSANLARDAAMTEAQLLAALRAGRASVVRAKAAGAELYVGGEMGIANTTAATALACALLGESPQRLTGRGTGVDDAGLARKCEAIERALALHRESPIGPAEALRRLGGFEIAALAGAYLACARLGLPALVDGFIASAAALAACRINPGVGDWLLYGHRSAESGHAAVLAALGAAPLLDLGLRLGEGSGAAAALPLLRVACALHNGMATFADAGVSEKLEA